MPQYLSRVMMFLCNWCKQEVEDSMVTRQRDGEIICLHCLCASHGNLKAYLTDSQREKLQPR